MILVNLAGVEVAWIARHLSSQLDRHITDLTAQSALLRILTQPRQALETRLAFINASDRSPTLITQERIQLVCDYQARIVHNQLFDCMDVEQTVNGYPL